MALDRWFQTEDISEHKRFLRNIGYKACDQDMVVVLLEVHCTVPYRAEGLFLQLLPLQFAPCPNEAASLIVRCRA
jgi:hypothetical protein